MIFLLIFLVTTYFWSFAGFFGVMAMAALLSVFDTDGYVMGGEDIDH